MSWTFKFWEKTPWGAAKDAPTEEKKDGAAPAGKKAPEPKGMEKKMLRFLKSPQGAGAAKKINELVERMKKEGVDVEDEAQVKAWIEKHKAELGAPAEGAEPKAPFHAKALPGRNDPCVCGSGKKFKKCCEGKTAAA